MGKKILDINCFNKASIIEAEQFLKFYDKQIKELPKAIAKNVAERLAEIIKINASEAWVDDIATNGEGMHIADITVQAPSEQSNGYIVVSQGKELLFAEFGAGIRYNSPVGTSPNPKGAEMGYTIGSYGKGLGKNMRWFFEHPDGKESKGKNSNGKRYKMSLGTPASMPVYSSVKQVIEEYPQIAKQTARELGL